MTGAGDRKRTARCSCGQLRAIVRGEIGGRVSICHCLACQRRTGGPFGVQIRLDAGQVEVHGQATEYTRHADDDGEARTYRFCPGCGATVYYTFEHSPEWVIVPIGAFADPGLPAPVRSVREDRRHPWVTLPDTVVEHDA